MKYKIANQAPRIFLKRLAPRGETTCCICPSKLIWCGPDHKKPAVPVEGQNIKLVVSDVIFETDKIHAYNEGYDWIARRVDVEDK